MRGRLSLVAGLVFVGLLLCWFFSGSARAQRPRVRPVGRVKVVDSRGNTVGTVIGGLGLTYVHNALINGQFAPTVLLEVDGRLIAVHISQDNFFTNTILYFESNNCSGTPFLPVGWENLPILVSAIGPPGHTAYLAVRGSQPRVVTTRSELFRGLCRFSGSTERVFPAEALIDLDTEFTPPFELRTEP